MKRKKGTCWSKKIEGKKSFKPDHKFSTVLPEEDYHDRSLLFTYLRRAPGGGLSTSSRSCCDEESALAMMAL